MAPSRGFTICKVWDAEYPWDVRAEKVCVALTSAGYPVHMVARNRRRESVQEVRPEATIHRLRPWRWAPRAIDAASMFPAFFNPRWTSRIHEVAQQTGAALVLCRDLPLAIPCIRVARRLGLPVVLDMAENYPAMLRARHASGRAGLADVVVRSPGLAQRVEDWVLPRVDGVLTVVEESRDRLVAKGVPPERVTVVSNTPPLSRVGSPVPRHDRDQSLRLAYIGLLELQRGLATLLDAVATLRRDGVAVHLALLGGGRDEAVLRQRAVELGLDQSVTFHGWIPNEVALARLAEAHVGVIPHWKDDSWDTTIPNKLFDYMAAALPVITSDTAPVARIVSDTGCGVVFRNRDAADLARVIRTLADPGRRALLGTAGRKAVQEQYHWERDVERLLRFLDTIHATYPRTSPAPPERAPA